MLKLHTEMDAKLTDLEGRSRRENIRIHGVNVGSEDDAPSMTAFVERLLKLKLELPDSSEIRVKRANRALVPKPPPNTPPRSIVAKLASCRTKEEILKLESGIKGEENPVPNSIPSKDESIFFQRQLCYMARWRRQLTTWQRGLAEKH